MNKQQLPTPSQQKISWSVVEQYRTKITPLTRKLLADDIKKENYTMASGKLLFLFDLIQQRFPEKNMLPISTTTETIWVLDLACGVPVSYLALKTQYPNARIRFVAIDIDAAENKVIAERFAGFPDFTILTADASDLIEMLQLLKQHNLAPQGFSLIFLRQPDFINQERSPAFLRMLSFTIPQLATANARVFISSYHEIESRTIRQMLDAYSDCYQAIITKKEGFLLQGIYTFSSGEDKLEPDSFTQFLDCKGAALKAFNHREKMFTLMVSHISKHSPITLEWQFSDKSQALYATHTDQALLKSIKIYLEQQHHIHSIKLGKVATPPGNFCIQIWNTDTQVAQLEKVPPMPKDAFELTSSAVTTAGLAPNSIWSNPASSATQASTTNTTATENGYSVQSPSTTVSQPPPTNT